MFPMCGFCTLPNASFCAVGCYGL
jgi:hypothetical protein